MKFEHFWVRSSAASCLQLRNLNKLSVANNNKFNEWERVCTNASIWLAVGTRMFDEDAWDLFWLLPLDDITESQQFDWMQHPSSPDETA